MLTPPRVSECLRVHPRIAFGPTSSVLQDGRFVSPSLPPGRYIIAAAAMLSPGEITADLLQAVRAQGQALELGDREVRRVDVTAIVGAK
jgi:glycine/D-amino acid oxidase-like deaminating enzyme